MAILIIPRHFGGFCPHGHRQLHRLLHVLPADAPDDHGALVQHLGPLGGGAHQHAAKAQHGALLGQGAAVGQHAEGVLLQVVVVQKAEGAHTAHQGMELEGPLLDKLHAAGVGGVDHRYLVFLGHVVDGIHQLHEVALVVDVLLPVGGNQDIAPLFQAQPLQGVAGVDGLHVGLEDLPHGGAGDEDGLSVDALPHQVAPGVLGIGHVDVADMVHDFAVHHFRYVPVPAAVARLHVEDGHLQPLGGDGGQGGIGVPQHQQGVGGLLPDHPVAGGDDVAHGLPQVRAHAVEVKIRRPQAQVLKEHLV